MIGMFMEKKQEPEPNEEKSEEILFSLSKDLIKLKNQLHREYAKGQPSSRVDMILKMIKKREDRLRQEHERMEKNQSPWTLV